MKRNLPAYMICLVLTGCCVYHPQPTDIPLINKKNDLRIDAGISVIPSVHATVSYGLTKKIAIQAFGSIEAEDKAYFHLAPGVFKDLGNNKVMELYGGFGYGYGDAYKDSNPGHLLGNYQVYFVQYNFGKYDCKPAHMDYGFGIKTGYFRSVLTDKNYYDNYSGDGPFETYNEKSILIEPMAVIRLGGEKVKFSLKAGACWILKITNPNRYIPTHTVNIGLGINFSLKDLAQKE